MYKEYKSMMKFIVLGRREIKDFHTDIKHIVISIKDPERKCKNAILPKQSSRLHTLYLSFHDLDKEYKNIKFFIKLFSQSDANKILNFFNKYKDKVELVICQCEAGISRSAGVAGALSKITGQDDNIFFKKYIPNRLVYRLILEEYYKENNCENRDKIT